MRAKQDFRRPLLAIAVFTAVTSGAQGQEAGAMSDGDAKVLEEVFVLGQRRAYQGNFDNLEKPSADQTMSLELLEEVGALNLNDALDLSASVARQNNFGGLWNSFSIRGFAGDINLPSGFLVNGFNAGRGYGGPRDLVGIESVEVLKGPRAALFGRGEPGGTVNLVTKRPDFETKGFARATIGQWQQYRFEGDYQSTAGSSDQVGFRLVGFYEDAESFRETVESEKYGFFPSVTWQMTDRTRLTYELEYSRQEIPFDRGVAFTEEFGFTPRKTFSGEPGDGPIETEVFGHQIELQHNFSDNWSLLAGFGYRDTSFTGTASETNFQGRQTLLLDGRTLSRFVRYRDFESEYTVLRAELAGQFETGGLKHRLLVGADYDRFDNSLFILRYRPGFFPPETDINTLDPAAYLFLDVFDPVYGQFPQPELSPNTDREEELSGTGVYIQDQIDLTDNFQVRVGLRYDDFSQDLTNLRATPASTVSSSDSRVSPQIGAVYLLNDGVSLYASYGEGYRQQTGSDFQGNQFEPNLTESTELGVKADLGHFYSDVSGSVSLTLFEVEQSNILVNDDRPEATAAGFFLTSQGAARSRGVELDANLSTEGGFNLWFSYAYVDAENTSTNPDPSFGATVEKGDPLINAPENQINVQVSQAFTLGDMQARVGGGFLFTDERLGWTGFDFYLPDYTTARLFGELEPAPGLTLRLDVDNLFDETFYTNSFADVWVEPGAPRRFRLTATYAF